MQIIEASHYSQAQCKGKTHGIHLGGVELARNQEVRHLVVVGKTGSGKTVLLTGITDQVLARGDRVMVHDPKGDFTQRYFDPRHAVILGPWDARALLWDAATDIDSPALADQFAAACVGEVQGDNKSFHDNAARVVAGLIKSHMREGHRWTWADLAADLELDPRHMAARAAQGDLRVAGALPSAFREDGRGLTNGDSATFSIVSSGMGWVANYAAVYRPDTSTFSITRWLLQQDHADTTVVILNNNAQCAKAARAIFGAVMQSAVAVVNSAKMPERPADAPDALWVVADELPQAGTSTIEALQKPAELGRSRGIRLVEAMQDESQLGALLGPNKAKPMLAVQGARIHLQCSDDAAESVSRQVGDREISRIENTSESGAVGGKRKTLVIERMVRPSDLTGLRVQEAGAELILQVQDSLARVVVPFPEQRPPIAEALVESETWRMGVLPGRAALPGPAAPVEPVLELPRPESEAESAAAPEPESQQPADVAPVVSDSDEATDGLFHFEPPEE